MNCHGPQIDVADLELSPRVGKWSDNYLILKRFRMDLGESWEFAAISRYFSPNILGIGDSYGQANQAHQSQINRHVK